MKSKGIRCQPYRHAFGDLPPRARFTQTCVTPYCQNPAHYHLNYRHLVQSVYGRFNTTPDELTVEDILNLYPDLDPLQIEKALSHE